MDNTIIIEKHSSLSLTEKNIDFSKSLIFLIQEYSELNISLLITNNLSNINNNINITFILSGNSSKLKIRSTVILDNNYNINIITKQIHMGINSESDIIIKSLLFDNANFFYTGTINIDKNAPNSIASQINKNILFSNNSRAISTPILEVLTDQVKCSHASASGFFDKEHLFYLYCRGFDIKSAHQLLIESFLYDSISTSTNISNIRKHILTVIDKFYY